MQMGSYCGGKWFGSTGTMERGFNNSKPDELRRLVVVFKCGTVISVVNVSDFKT